ncbi:hypothetical protein H1S01_17825 [Heliobacterium chlorum]|uniref:Uncharacterized protein n=1 Tax=Heliobacterium chlorum TaxID=2698 RepID=A0ABR7T9D2_HELCL|nr:hypothetical protein [Heliobacterium chlorum]MBC9786321.1 hypothetical protein [Heliobacterium chlorum]
MNKSGFLSLTLDGPDLIESVDLHNVLSILTEIHKIFDKTYAILSNTPRLQQSDRNIFQIRASNFRKGSFVVDLDVVLRISQLAIFGASLYPETIVKYTQQSYIILRLVFQALRDGKSIRIIKDENTTVIIDVEGERQIFSMESFEIAKEVRDHYISLTDTLESKKIENIKMVTPLMPVLNLNFKDKNFFDSTKNFEDTPLDVIADICKFDKETNKGKLRVYDEQNIRSGYYNFSVADNLQLNIIQSMINSKTNVKIVCEIESNPLDGHRISKLKILDIRVIA